MTTVRLAVVTSAAAINGFPVEEQRQPSLLSSYVYLKTFQLVKQRINFKTWVLDSGAFSASTLGIDINVKDYCTTAKHLLNTDPKLTEVFALDVIGDHKAGLQNCEYMWSEGVPAIPCYHLGEPINLLLHLAKEYPKIALGGCARLKGKAKLDWAADCFTRIWPKAVHGFGFGAKALVLGIPFHSVDASSWEFGPLTKGSWRSWGGRASIKGSNQNMRHEVDYYLNIERDAKWKWKKEMELIATIYNNPREQYLDDQ